MVYNPFNYIERFIEMGADMITIHFEATEEIEDILNYVRRCGKKVALAFNPETSVSLVVKYLDKCDGILFMSVNPGLGGQKFIPEILDKIEFTRQLCNKLNIRQGGVTQLSDDKNILPPYDIQVDGGINIEIAKQCIKKGANILVSGDHLFSSNDMKKSIEELKG